MRRDQFGYEYIKTSETERNARPRLDGIDPSADGPIRIQEVEGLIADPLKPPQRLLPEDSLDTKYQCIPCPRVLFKRGQRVAVPQTRVAHVVHDCCLLVGVLYQEQAVCRSRTGHVRDDMPPIVLDEFLGQPLCRDYHRPAGVVARFH
jgi:hypothetical protein